jgi:hypothetical protein
MNVLQTMKFSAHRAGCDFFAERHDIAYSAAGLIVPAMERFDSGRLPKRFEDIISVSERAPNEKPFQAPCDGVISLDEL